MRHEFKAIPEWRDVDAATLRNEIAPRNQPAVLRGLVRDWPAVARGGESVASLCDFLKGFASGRPVEAYVGPPSIDGRFFYTPDMKGVNFDRIQEPLPVSLDRLQACLPTPQPPAIFIQSAPTPEHLPGFREQHPMALLDPRVTPRAWIGNGVTVRTHFDLNDNIACVVAGRRRFTLFPPDQLANLYVGPFEFTLAGPPVSMADPDAPDLERYPRFAAALAVGQQAELGPGDAIFIPYGWWHHVRSLERFNMLVNYWWNEAPPGPAAPFDALLHALLAVRDLPERQREVWREFFDYYVFKSHGDPVAHLPREAQGTLGALSPEQAMHMKATLLKAMARP